jgi:hypothetical protein
MPVATYNTRKRQKSMHPAGFEHAVPARERPLAYIVDAKATGIGYFDFITYQ